MPATAGGSGMSFRVAAAVCWACALMCLPTIANCQEMLTEQEAAARLASLFGFQADDIRAGGLVLGPARRLEYRFYVSSGDSDYDDYSVDAYTGDLTSMILSQPWGEGDWAITQAEAEGLARAYCAAKGIPITEDFSVSQVTTDAELKTFELWFRQSAGTIALPGLVVVEMDGRTGAVFTLFSERPPLAVSIDPPYVPEELAGVAGGGGLPCPSVPRYPDGQHGESPRGMLSPGIGGAAALPDGGRARAAPSHL